MYRCYKRQSSVAFMALVYNPLVVRAEVANTVTLAI